MAFDGGGEKTVRHFVLWNVYRVETNRKWFAVDQSVWCGHLTTGAVDTFE